MLVDTSGRKWWHGYMRWWTTLDKALDKAKREHPLVYRIAAAQQILKQCRLEQQTNAQVICLMLVKESEIPGSDNYEWDFFIGWFKSHAGCRTVHCVGLSPALEDVQGLSAPPVKHHCPQSRRQSHTSPKDHHGVHSHPWESLSEQLPEETSRGKPDARNENSGAGRGVCGRVCACACACTCVCVLGVCVCIPRCVCVCVS